VCSKTNIHDSFSSDIHKQHLGDTQCYTGWFRDILVCSQ